MLEDRLVHAATRLRPRTISSTAQVSDTIGLQAIPVVSSVTPSSGPALGGQTVTILGSYFNGATVVRFGATPAKSFTVNSASKITAVAPSGPGGVTHAYVRNP